MLIFIVTAVWSLKRGEAAGADPWDGRTLEWSISSPPPEYNFEQIPTVHGRDPFWTQKRERVVTVPVAGGSGEEGENSVHLPQPSYWPVVSAIGLFIASYGVLYSATSNFGLAAAALGGAVTMISVYAWSLGPVNDPVSDLEDHSQY